MARKKCVCSCGEERRGGKCRVESFKIEHEQKGHTPELVDD